MTDNEREAFEALCVLEQRWPAGTRVRVVGDGERVGASHDMEGEIGTVLRVDNMKFSHHVGFDAVDNAFRFDELELVEPPKDPLDAS